MQHQETGTTIRRALTILLYSENIDRLTNCQVILGNGACHNQEKLLKLSFLWGEEDNVKNPQNKIEKQEDAMDLYLNILLHSDINQMKTTIAMSKTYTDNNSNFALLG